MSDEEFYYEYTEHSENWKNIIMINPDKSVSQVSRLNSEASSILGNSVWTYFNKNPADAQGFNVCKKCSTKYKSSISITILRNYLKKHQIEIPIKKHKAIIKRKDHLIKKNKRNMMIILYNS